MIRIPRSRCLRYSRLRRKAAAAGTAELIDSRWRFGFNSVMSDTDKANTKKLRLGVLISGGGRTMINLHELAKVGELPAEVTIVIASRQCKGVERAESLGLPVQIVPYKEMPDTETYSARIVELLDAAGVNLVIQAGFLSLWQIPAKYEGRVMNIHPALLPDFGGKGMFGHHVHEAVIAAGRKTSGCTVHFVTNEYDSGRIILQREVPVLEDDDADSLAARVFEQECIAYPEAIRMFAEGKLSR